MLLLDAAAVVTFAAGTFAGATFATVLLVTVSLIYLKLPQQRSARKVKALVRSAFNMQALLTQWRRSAAFLRLNRNMSRNIKKSLKSW